MDAPEWAVLRCAGKGERCGSTGTCVPVDSANALRLRLSRALQGGQRCGLLLDKAEQRGQRAVARLNRVRSAVTQNVIVIEEGKVNIHAAFLRFASGQLRFPG